MRREARTAPGDAPPDVILGCEDPDGSDDSGDSAGGCSLRYFDSRGVSRRYAFGAEAGVWRFWRDRAGFSQRFTGTLSADGTTR